MSARLLSCYCWQQQVAIPFPVSTETALTSYSQHGEGPRNLMGGHNQTEAELAMYDVATREENNCKAITDLIAALLAIPFLQQDC
jgi:hypothetical protein